MGANTTAVTDDNWATEVQGAGAHVLVDFWAPWCGPCKMIGPTLEELAGEYGDKLKIAKMDVDENDTTAQKFAVRNIPCLILFKGGQEVDRVVGLHNKAQLKTWLDSKMQG